MSLHISLPLGEGKGWGSSTGVDTPAYAVSPYGLVMSLHISLPLGKFTEKAFAFIFTITTYQSICYNHEGKNFAFIISRFFRDFRCRMCRLGIKIADMQMD